MKKYIKSVVALTAICAVVSILLSITNYITAPVIEKMPLQRQMKHWLL